MTATVLTLLVIPAVYFGWRDRELRRPGLVERIDEALHDEAATTEPAGGGTP